MGDGRRPSCEGEETWRRSQPHSARRSSVIHAAPQETAVRTAHRQPQREERGAPKRTAQSATALSSQIGIMPHSRLQWMVPRTPTVRHAAHRPLPSQKKQKAEPGTPSLPSHRRGNTNNRRCGQSVPIAGKKRGGNGGMSAAQPAEGHSTGHGNTKWQWST
ncbi:hypothetical protein TcCL_Unassigned04855, partial [Trypanosoma cruzi]